MLIIAKSYKASNLLEILLIVDAMVELASKSAVFVGF